MATIAFPTSPTHGDIKNNGNLTYTYDSDYSIWVVTSFPTAPRGIAATIAIGTVTTLDSDASATVINVGDSADAILDFGIPRGIFAGLPANALVDSDLGVSVQAYDADTLKADLTDTLTVGYAATPYNAGTKSSGTFTPDEANGNFQYGVNGGAHTLAPPTNNCTIVIQYTNNASAGTITTSGFTIVVGDTLTTTNGDDFMFYITKNNGFSVLSVVALQ